MMREARDEFVEFFGSDQVILPVGETDGRSMLAAAHPDTVDEVYRTVLCKPAFTWAKQSELLLRKRKPWYFKRPPYPKVTPTSEYLVELLSS